MNTFLFVKIGMLFNNTKKKKGKGKSHLHYGTAKKAKQTIRYLTTRSHGEQVRGAQTMYFRAKYHAHQTQDMREAMNVYKRFLNTIKTKQ